MNCVEPFSIDERAAYKYAQVRRTMSPFGDEAEPEVGR